MAVTTTVLLQAALDTISGSAGEIIITEEAHDGTTSRWYCVGSPSTVSSPAVINAPRAMWCLSTDIGSAAAQAAEVVAAMTATVGTIDGNNDPDIGP